MAYSLTDEFPIWALVPKKETGVTNFLTKYPEYDGRGTVIVILDSGVDPAAAGLQVTTTGLVKVIERYDCSGAGDVDTSTIVKPVDGTIQLLSGRTLKIPSTWNNPSGEYRVGLKHMFPLYPKKLGERIQKEFKEEHWDPTQQTSLAAAHKKLQEFENEHTNNSLLTAEEKSEKDDLEARIEILTNFEKKYQHPGSIYDCILFFDGEVWQACISDTISNESLDAVKLLGEFSKTHDHRYLSEKDQYTISINVHDHGNTLEIVGMSSEHGTHVASIASANFPDMPEKNGVAPGAQIISLTIGDSRLDGMETGTGLIRALIKLTELIKLYPYMIINMSYGEYSHWCDSGRIMEQMNDVVNKYGIIFVCSAGNHGPGLFTVSTPPDISQPTVIGVGAYVSPDMMIAEYSLCQKKPSMMFSWSSCGPTKDGHNGVTICAPGAAITSVCAYTLSSSQLMNGTSMASPNASGVISLILSGLKARKKPYSPYNVKRALENTALFLKDSEVFSQGYGLIQVDAAFNWLVDYSECVCRDLRLNILVDSTNKGILIQDANVDLVIPFRIEVTPVFLDNYCVSLARKTQFNINLALTCNANDYVQHPAYFSLSNTQRLFTVYIDPRSLKTGVYSTTINGYDTNCLEKGPVLRIPVTVIKPILIKDPVLHPQLEWKNMKFTSHKVEHIFVNVPEFATWAVVNIRSDQVGKSDRFYISTLQVQPKQSCSVLSTSQLVLVQELSDNVHGFQVKGGLVLQVTIAKFWNSLEDIEVNYTLTFHGVKPNSSSIVMHGATGVQMVQLRTLRNEEILPSAVLKYCVHPLRPSESKINVLTSRDVIYPERQIYELVLTYNFHIAKQTEVKVDCQTLSDMLYESEFDSQLWFIYDNNKKLLAVGDAYPHKYTQKLEKGDYTLKLHIRHEKKNLLENYTDIPVSIIQKLINSITSDIYPSKSAALIRGKKISVIKTQPGRIYPIYINALPNDKTAKIINPGQYLIGNITFAKDELGKSVDIYPFRYIVPDPIKKTNGKPVDKDKTKYEEYLEALRELKTSWLVKLEGSSEAYQLYNQMKENHNNDYTVHLAMLQSVDPFDVKKHAPLLPLEAELTDEQNELFSKIETISDEVIEQIDQNKLLAFYGVKSDNRSDAAKIKTEMDRQKNAVIEALTRKGIILSKKYFVADDNDDIKEELSEKIKKIWSDIIKYVEHTDTKVIFFSMWHALLLEQYGRLLKYMLKYSEDKASKELDQRIISVLNILSWTHCSKNLQNSVLIKFPNNYKF